MVSDRTGDGQPFRVCADVAQLVEHHLAKVRVAGSSPVVRSERVSADPSCGGLAERRGSGLQSRLHGFESRTHLGENHGFRFMPDEWAIGAAVARFPDTEEVTGSNPVSPTRGSPGQRRFSSSVNSFVPRTCQIGLAVSGAALDAEHRSPGEYQPTQTGSWTRRRRPPCAVKNSHLSSAN
jgi:hypothetical protein